MVILSEILTCKTHIVIVTFYSRNKLSLHLWYFILNYDFWIELIENNNTSRIKSKIKCKKSVQKDKINSFNFTP